MTLGSDADLGGSVEYANSHPYQVEVDEGYEGMYANSHPYKVKIVGGLSTDFDDLTGRPKYDGEEMTHETDIPKVPEKTSELENDTDFVEDADYVHTDNNYVDGDKAAVANLNGNYVTNLDYSADGSTVSATESRKNIYTGAITTDVNAFPVANGNQAGVMNAATFQAVQNNATDINAILNGAVSISGIVENPTQAELTNAWKTATSLDEVINGAKINDPDNQKVWTYYVNVATWFPATNTTQVVVNDASNTQKGIVKGSASGDGTIFVEADTTMSVNGWDGLVATVANKQDALEAGDNIEIENNVISAVDTTYGDFEGATSEEAGASGLVPAPEAGDEDKYLKGDGTWGEISSRVKVLTSADYNWPVDNPTSVAFWLLDSGIYIVSNGTSITRTTSSYIYDFPVGMSNMYLVDKGFDGYSIVFGFGNGMNAVSNRYAAMQTLVLRQSDGGSQGANAALTFRNVVDSLTSNETQQPLSAAQGKALKNLIDSLVIKGAGAPTTSTVGTVGKLYEDTTNGKLYQCTAVNGSEYTWEEIGGGVNVVQTTGDSTEDVMSQKAVTDMVFSGNDIKKIRIGRASGTAQGIAIGEASLLSSVGVAIGGYDISTASNKVSVSGQYAIGIGGHSASAGGNRSICISSYGGKASGNGSIALGAHSNATAQGEMNIGSTNITYGYNNTNYRLLSGVHDGQSDHDACTKGQLDAAIAGVSTNEITNSDWSALWQ